MSSLAFIGSRVEDTSIADNTQYPHEIKLISSMQPGSLPQPSGTWLIVRRTPKDNASMEVLIHPEVYGKDSSAPWHGLARVEDVREGKKEGRKDGYTPNAASKRKLPSAKKSRDTSKSWSVIGKEMSRSTEKI